MTGLSFRLTVVATVVCLGAFQFGFHMAELNAPEAYISCRNADAIDCIPMNPKQIGLVNSIYAVGGVLSALSAGRLADKYGRKGLSLMITGFFIIGPLFMSGAQSVNMLMMGRFLSGLGAGASVVVTPIFLNEISPADLKGTIGSFSQILINMGILLAQALGYFLSKNGEWRYILATGSGLGLLNLVLLPFVGESPRWLSQKGHVNQARKVLCYLRGCDDVEDELNEIIRSGSSTDTAAFLNSTSTADLLESNSSLLDIPNSAHSNTGLINPEGSKGTPAEPVTIREFCTEDCHRKKLKAIVGLMTAQQLTGMNSIVFYGVEILASTMSPEYAKLLNCFISFVNLFVTVVLSPLIDKYGRKPVLVISLAGLSACSAILCLGVMTLNSELSVFGIVGFVISFAGGMGPIPFLMVGELVDRKSAGVAQSVGMTASWLATFLIGFLFPIINTLVGGYVFALFAIVGVGYLVFLVRNLPETKGKDSVVEVWNEIDPHQE
ncbi:general substrate transporter [Nadsonia fulvescens var. elongata DSM 6958]|uniref:General substrate transporter n=1 Tax=Nadsonia fulvescens var. elongata DSM 6958 TaxID=857566 RepID=A0A1E3PJW8_9ASCO|nr:general substrate transporter [Nadsonia fulvescens var. elongata DSM 6958]